MGKMVDGVALGEVPLEKGKYRLFSNVTTVLPLSGLVGGDTGAFTGPRVPPLIGHRSQNPRNRKTAA